MTDIEHFKAQRPGSPFSSAVRIDDLYYFSGQIGNDSTGSIPEDYADEARNTMQNIGAALHAVGLDFSNVVKCTVMLEDMSRWRDFNAVYLEFFEQDKLPARSAFGCASLVGKARMEVEVIAAR